MLEVLERRASCPARRHDVREGVGLARELLELTILECTFVNAHGLDHGLPSLQLQVQAQREGLGRPVLPPGCAALRLRPPLSGASHLSTFNGGVRRLLHWTPCRGVVQRLQRALCCGDGGRLVSSVGGRWVLPGRGVRWRTVCWRRGGALRRGALRRGLRWHAIRRRRRGALRRGVLPRGTRRRAACLAPRRAAVRRGAVRRSVCWRDLYRRRCGAVWHGVRWSAVSCALRCGALRSFRLRTHRRAVCRRRRGALHISGRRGGVSYGVGRWRGAACSGVRSCL